jgi:putative colanic acid biosynthesis acetyltransferase WcaF
VPWNLRVDEEASIGYGVDCYDVGLVHLGPHSTVSRFAMLCTAGHDIADPHMRLVGAPVRIERGAWVCQAAYVGMGVTVGEGAVIAACAVAVEDVPAWTVVAGNPARGVKMREVKT